jgi:hypothetical protein
MSMQSVAVYLIGAACAAWLVWRIYHNVNKIRRGQNVCNGCGGACGGKSAPCCERKEKEKNHESPKNFRPKGL